MADEADNKEETTGAGDATVETAEAPESAARKTAAKKPVAAKAPVKKAPVKKPAAKVETRRVPLKKLDVKSLADELKAPLAVAAKAEEKAPAEKPGAVKAVPVKTGSGQRDAKRAAVSDFAGPAASAVLMRRVPERHVTDFLRQLIMLLRAGTPILRSLQTLSKRSSNRSARALIADITQYVEAGNPLWQAFDRHNRYFDRVFVNLIRASEASGTLVTVLTRLVAYRTKRELMTRRVMGAMIYPVLLILACTAVLLVITKLVVPEFVDIFKSAGIEVNSLTQFVFDSSAIIGTWWWTVYVAIVVLFFGYREARKRIPWVKVYGDMVKVRFVPIAREIFHKHALAELCRTLAMLIRSGVSMMQTLELTRSAVGNSYVADCLKDVRDSIERGGGMEGPLRKSAPAIPPVMADMLVTGEDSGRVDDVADQLADIYEEEVEIRTESLGAALQPIFTVIVGLGVAILFIALFLPLITSMDQLAGNSGV